jgi:hypothetical protein
MPWGRLDTFLHTLETTASKPSAICFCTEGVRLVARNSPVLLGLKVLADAGVRMLVCQSCLGQYGLTNQVAVGTFGGTVEIVAAMLDAEKVVTV